MLLDVAKTHQLDLSKCYMVGDRWKDIECGISAGCKTIFINHHYSEKKPQFSDIEVDSLKKACDYILGE
jgi:D-glycero-D-manno-heptose 1,7-bisphosphate phosphatase